MNNEMIFRCLFAMIEEDRLNNNLFKLLEAQLKEFKENSEDDVTITFRNGNVIGIYKDIDSYYITMEPPIFDGEDAPGKPIGLDRLYFYLKRVATFYKSEPEFDGSLVGC